MASAADVAALRRLCDIPADNAEPYTDTVLSDLIDSQNGSIYRASALVWREKAAAYASLVDTTESGSSRKMSDLHRQALAMAGEMDDAETPPGDTAGVAFTWPVQRM